MSVQRIASERKIPPLRAVAAALASGFLYAAAFALPTSWPVALVAHVPLLWALGGVTPSAAAKLGGCMGLFASALGFWWLQPMLEQFAGLGTAGSVALTALFCAYASTRFALFAWLRTRAVRGGWPAAIAGTTALAASELAIPMLFPWFFGASVVDSLWLVQVADLGGPVLASVVAYAPSEAIIATFAVRAPRSGLLARLRAALLPTGVFIVGVVYGGARVAQIDARAESAPALAVGLLQPNTPLLHPGDTVTWHREQTIALRDRGADLVVWSESAIAEPFPETDYDRTLPAHIARDLGVPTIVGIVLFSPRAAGDGAERATHPRMYNAAISVTSDGAVRGRYDKRYLLPFGERIPLGDTFPTLYDALPNAGRLTPGDEGAALPSPHGELATFICYEDLFPGYVRELVTADTALLINLTNDAWFGDTAAPRAHLAQARLRAVEHRRALVRATNSGVSAIVDPVGRVDLAGSNFRRQALLGEAKILQIGTIFNHIGQAPAWLLAAAAALLALLPRPRRQVDRSSRVERGPGQE